MRGPARCRLPLLAAVLMCACSDESALVIRTQFDDCSLDPERVSRLVYFLEPRDQADLPRLEPFAREQDGIAVAGDDIDADQHLEYVLGMDRAHFDIRDGFSIRVVLHGEPPGTLLLQAMAGDDAARQIGTLSGEALEIDFRDGETVSIDVPLVCLCNGMQGCGGTCPERFDGCRPIRDRERYCHDGLDNGGDPLTDCADPECYHEGPCEACGPEVCDDALDDDCDLTTDCGDDDCAESSSCVGLPEEICANGADDDRDTRPDCLDDDCADHPACTQDCADSRPETCTNRRDDDCDHLVDCADPDCERPDEELACQDSFDDDCDDLADCADPDCYDLEACQGCATCCDPEAERESDASGQACHDRQDNDCDGDFDCEDRDCFDATPEDCADGQDNDCDARSDCADDDCPTSPSEICDNDYDDDCDGDRDCDDADCLDDSTQSLEGDCDDLKDNDCNGDRDCEDEACAQTAVCAETHSASAR